MSDTPAPLTRTEAYEAGHAIGTEGKARLHDLTSQMVDLGIPVDVRGNWLSGVEDAVGTGGEGDEDGHGWERRALAGL